MVVDGILEKSFTGPLRKSVMSSPYYRSVVARSTQQFDPK